MSKDSKREFEIPIEQKVLLNCGHGPPIGPPNGPPTGPTGPPELNFQMNRRIETNRDVWKGNSEVVSQLSGAGAILDIHDNSRQLMLLPPSGIIGPCYVISTHPTLYANHMGENLSNSGQQSPNKNQFQTTVQGHGSMIDALRKQNEVLREELALKSKEFDDVRKELASKSEEFEDLKSKFRHLTDQLNDVSISEENDPDNRLIDLAATDEMTGGRDCWREMRLEDEEDLMMKSVQCSEISVEPCKNEHLDAGQVFQATERGRASSGSNTSFEVVGVVGQECCEDHQAVKTLDDKCYVAVRQSTEDFSYELNSVKSQLEAFEPRLKQVEALKPRLEQVEALRPKLEQVESLKQRLDELSAIVHQGARPKRNAGAAEFMLSGVGPNDFDPEKEALRQKVSELTAAKWKLTEQVKVLEKENEELKSGMTVGDIKKFQAVRASDLEGELRVVRQCLSEAEARIRELESEQRNAGQFVIQHNTDQTVIQLTTENALLTTQIEAYREDFQVERKEKEKLQRFYDILRNDLDNARRQLRKYEDDITSLRIDNETMRKKLREVTEQLSVKESSALPDPSGEWKCQACTFKNPSRRSTCEICGTGKDGKASLTPRGPGASDFSTEELEPDRCRNEARTAPLLSNLRNYGDIETD